MFEHYNTPPIDTLVELMLDYRNDDRSFKIDLGFGNYKDSAGNTPIMRSVKAAEQRVWRKELSKSYLGPSGDDKFCKNISDLVLGNSVESQRIRSIQTVGGSAALRLLCDLISENNWSGTLWIPNPTWTNHIPTAVAAGLKVREYTYLNRESSAVDFDQLTTEIKNAQDGDAILLQACCHNPTGADLTLDQWADLTEIVQRKNLLPFVDIAYQGFGDGLEKDVRGLQLLASSVPEIIISTSCSKNFGVYRERVGSAILVAKSTADVDKAWSFLISKGRVSYAFPPNHGAAAISTIFSDQSLFDDWKSELEFMRIRIIDNRNSLADALKKSTNLDRFEFIRNNKGMFSLIGLTKLQIAQLRREFALFMPPNGRMNIAAINENDVATISSAIASVI